MPLDSRGYTLCQNWLITVTHLSENTSLKCLRCHHRPAMNFLTQGGARYCELPVLSPNHNGDKKKMPNSPNKVLGVIFRGSEVIFMVWCTTFDPLEKKKNYFTVESCLLRGIKLEKPLQIEN